MAPAQLAVADGHVYVEGRSAETARALLAAATAAGAENTVKTSSFGYFVPDAVHEAYLAGLNADGEDPEGQGGEDPEGQGGEDPEGQGGEDPEGQKAVEFDPSEAKVEEVLEYLAGADEDERKRVLDAEIAGKHRVTITEGAK